MGWTGSRGIYLPSLILHPLPVEVIFTVKFLSDHLADHFMMTTNGPNNDCRLLRFMGSIAGGVPETARVPFSPCASYTHNIDGSHMTIFTLNSLLQSGSGPDQELDPFHGQVYLYIYLSIFTFVLKKVTSYIAQHSILRISQSALHFTPWKTCSIEHYLGFSGKISAMWRMMHKDYSFTNINHCL